MDKSLEKQYRDGQQFEKSVRWHQSDKNKEPNYDLITLFYALQITRLCFCMDLFNEMLPRILLCRFSKLGPKINSSIGLTWCPPSRVPQNQTSLPLLIDPRARSHLQSLVRVTWPRPSLATHSITWTILATDLTTWQHVVTRYTVTCSQFPTVLSRLPLLFIGLLRLSVIPCCQNLERSFNEIITEALQNHSHKTVLICWLLSTVTFNNLTVTYEIFKLCFYYIL